MSRSTLLLLLLLITFGRPKGNWSRHVRRRCKHPESDCRMYLLFYAFGKWLRFKRFTSRHNLTQRLKHVHLYHVLKRWTFIVLKAKLATFRNV